MKFNSSDPKWTAYALGELPPAERAIVEKELAASAEARELVEELRETVGLLTSHYQESDPPELSAEQRREILQYSGHHPTWASRRNLWLAGGSLAAAAAIMMVIVLWPTPASDRGTDAAQPSKTGTVEIAEVPRLPPATTAKTAPEASRISGVVKDATGGIIPGASVTVQDTQTSSARSTMTDDAGLYSVDRLDPGEFAVDVTLPGFKSWSRNVRIQEGKQVELNARLEVGSISQTVEVRAAAPVVQATPYSSSARPDPAFLIAPNYQTRIVVNKADYSLPDVARQTFNTEAYDRIEDNPFVAVAEDPRSTFSIDVDTASYANLRRFLLMKELPPKDAIRIEEMINYFTYDYAPPYGADPVAIHVEVAPAPWKTEHRLVRVGLKAQKIERHSRSNLVFLLDVSGSMDQPAKLPLVKSAMKLLVDQLGENDSLAIVVYAGSSGLVLPATSGSDKEVIVQALEQLKAGGSTNGGDGIRLAYDTATRNFIPGALNRVILATDGDFNVGVTNQGDLTRLIEEKAKSQIFLSVLGFGMGNYKDSNLEKLADRGNGNYAYVDSLKEARRVLVEQMGSTLVTIAKDVKIQIEFNPAQVTAYRLIGYENRMLEHQDFNDDNKDAGDMGAGHTVTAFFELVPRGVPIDLPGVDPLKYQQPAQRAGAARASELLSLKLRYKEPESQTSRLMERAVLHRARKGVIASEDFRFASAVAAFGMILRDSPYKGHATIDSALRLAEQSQGEDPGGYRREFLNLVRRARALYDLDRP